jgi:mono/diheme cytochrome c family protein
MKLLLCGLATGFLWNAMGVSAAFGLVGSFTAVASIRRSNAALISSTRSVHVATAMRGADGRNLHPGMTLAGGFGFNEIDPASGHVIAPNITPDPDTGIGKWSEADTDAPPQEDKVAYGAYLVTFGHCVLCHAPPGDGTPLNMDLAFAGGRPFPALFGVGPSISRNIMSDPDQGLGKWTDDQIKDAIIKAVRSNGEKLAGPMAYDFYAKITPADLDAIVAFMPRSNQ